MSLAAKQLAPEPSPASERADPRASERVIVIDSTRKFWDLGLRELWSFRELLTFFVWRDLKVRYQQTILGAAWAILQPLATMAIFTLIFGRLAKVPTDGLPYPLLAFSGLLPWQLFANSLNQSANSMVTNRQIVLKIFFPRLVIPTSSVLSGLVDFAVASVILVVLMVYYSVPVTWTILLAPVFVGIALLSALAVGLWMAALNARYRDVKYMVPFITQIWLFASPVGYLAKSVPEQYQWLYNLNPMVGVVNGFRWSVLGSGGGMTADSLISIAVFVVFLVSGIWYFRRTESSFTDVL